MKRWEDKAWQSSMRIRLDFNNMLTSHVGSRGIAPNEIAEKSALWEAAARGVAAKRDQMKWRELPYTQNEIVKELQETAAYIRANFDTFVVLGIGGSALGPIAVQQALSHLRHNDLPAAKRNGPKLYVEDNIDPERLASLFDVIDIKRTAFNVITKSGSTSETMSQLLLFTSALREAVGENWTKHVVATTDHRAGNLITIARENGLRTFFVPDGVGGRFSELCPVGLLCAAVCGIDIEELLGGAAYMDALASEPNIWENPAYMAAALEYIAMGKGCNIGVLMPYADSLKYMADWYAQLWAESLGKSRNEEGALIYAGQTPVKALGVTDQHSQVQLYTEGPFDKVLTFLGVERYRKELAIPHAYDHLADVAFLSGHTFNELIQSEQRATEYAVTKSGHLNKTITLPEVNAFTIGELLYMFEVQTAFAGELLHINAFDQPGVEEGKNATYALLGKQGYDAKRQELSAAPAKEAANTI
ncbi:MAG: glucose-6-phosphate isomerase [Christensenellaceae bacterium]|jgi:glucose-6-phosphate isomerase|nr:glucose-6-phosphate isomerase [Christensenellaceae bacterium]